MIYNYCKILLKNAKFTEQSKKEEEKLLIQYFILGSRHNHVLYNVLMWLWRRLHMLIIILYEGCLHVFLDEIGQEHSRNKKSQSQGGKEERKRSKEERKTC